MSEESRTARLVRVNASLRRQLEAQKNSASTLRKRCATYRAACEAAFSEMQAEGSRARVEGEGRHDAQWPEAARRWEGVAEGLSKARAILRRNLTDKDLPPP